MKLIIKSTMRYTHLNQEERIELAELYSTGKSVNKIALLMKRSKSTISRELKRNKTHNNYWPDSAHYNARCRRNKGNKINNNADLQTFIWQHLVYKRWSPEQIAGWLKVNKPNFGTVSHESIYKWIYRPYEMHSGSKLWKFLARHKRKRGIKRLNSSQINTIPNRVSIHERPDVVTEKNEIGHWEGDLMSFNRNTQYILVLHERKTLFIQSAVLRNKEASTTAQTLLELMQPVPESHRKTITLDNGGEFAEHEKYKEIGLSAFFCDPYASWQKGGVENSNGRLRIVLPRDTNVKEIECDKFNQIILNHNSTPRKTLGWLTPKQAFECSLQKIIN